MLSVLKTNCQQSAENLKQFGTFKTPSENNVSSTTSSVTASVPTCETFIQKLKANTKTPNTIKHAEFLAVYNATDDIQDKALLLSTYHDIFYRKIDCQLDKFDGGSIKGYKDAKTKMTLGKAIEFGIEQLNVKYNSGKDFEQVAQAVKSIRELIAIYKDFQTLINTNPILGPRSK